MNSIASFARRIRSHSEAILRRSVSIPAVFFLSAASTVLAPAALPVLAASDLVRRRRFAHSRAYLLLWLYATCDSIGLVRAAMLRLRYPRGGEKFLAANFRLEVWWGNALFRGAQRIFGFAVEVEDPELAEGGPVLVFPRHVSPIDNLLPIVLVSRPYRTSLRWVINRWLQRDPCIDIVGHRLPNLFVSTSRRSMGEALGVAALGRELGPGDGVLVFPEGALFTRDRRDRMVEQLARTDPELYARAAKVKNLLPPRLGGVLGLLEEASGADVLFVGHHGLEGATKYASIAWGALVHARLRVKLWRVPAAEVPATADARAAWLYDWWERIDCWVESVAGEGHSGEYAALP